VKTIGEFLKSKIRRSEAEAQLQLVDQGSDDPEYGPLEACLKSQTGESHFYQNGLVLSDGERIRYVDIVQVTISGAESDGRLIVILGVQGEKIRIRCSELGGVVLHATLRWIGNALLKRRISS